MLKPALRRLWRDDTTLQLGVDPARAVVLAGVGSTEARLLAALNGTLDQAGVHRAAEELGVPHDATERLLTLLASADVLDDAGATAALGRLHAPERERLGPDLAALSLLHAGPGAGDRVLAARRERAVRVVGAGRIGAPLAALLAAAGVGVVTVDDPRACRHADSAPGGLTSGDTGLSRERATAAAVRRAAPEVVTVLPNQRRPDLTVLAGGPATVNEQTALLREHQPHLAVAIRESTGVVGPLVMPGVSACLRCLDVARTERDGAWSRLAAQLAGRRERAGDACDVVLAALVAAQAAAQTLAYLDRLVAGGAVPPTVGGSLELTFPDWRWRRRSWSPHPACGCCWPQSA